MFKSLARWVGMMDIIHIPGFGVQRKTWRRKNKLQGLDASKLYIRSIS